MAERSTVGYSSKSTSIVYICDMELIESQEYAFMQYVTVTSPIDMVHEALRCVSI